MELQPESDQQAAIRPTQFIYHSIAAPWTARRTYEFWRDSTNLESHFGLGFAGDLAQYIGTQTRADANYLANLRPDGTGAISLESASNLEHTDPWTDEQIPKLIDVGVWAHRTHGTPLRICRSWTDPGFGWHALHPEWAKSGTACPGAARIKQFKEVVFPGIVARAGGSSEEEDMTPEQEKKLDQVLGILKPYMGWQYKGAGKTDAWGLLNNTAATAAATAKSLAALSAKVDGLKVTGLTDAQVSALAVKVADVLAARMKD
ncbi:N-acetylmuramoyl-L-alanine amidase [Streptomyces cinereoruber]|uniref:N-acetylmuramoyl-L-alanine amidase n=1 Tax=Streptomyces cinereoruber TaxID=67260 RepID=UPI003659FE9A